MPKLPKFWKRVSRPEVEQKPSKKRSKSYWKRLADKDLPGKTRWPKVNSNLQGLMRELKFDIAEEVARRIKLGKNRVSVLDSGCGHGVALGELKDLFGDKVRTVGLTLQKSPDSTYRGVDRVVENRIEKTVMKESFDLVYSYIGAHFYTKQKITALKKTISWLKQGGKAVVDIGIHPGPGPWEEEYNELRTVLRANGITNWKFLRGSVLYFEKPTIKLPN
jgi:SAM-dependent methyltransferase